MSSGYTGMAAGILTGCLWVSRAHNIPLRVEIIPLEPDQRSDLRREAPSVLTHFSFRSVEELCASVLIFFCAAKPGI